MAHEMENEFMKRGYLLPKGCKDLSDILKPKAQPTPAKPQPSSPMPLPPITGELAVPEWMTVRELAKALGQKPFQIIADLIQNRCFATVSYQLDFDVIANVTRKYGLISRRRSNKAQNFRQRLRGFRLCYLYFLLLNVFRPISCHKIFLPFFSSSVYSVSNFPCFPF